MKKTKKYLEQENKWLWYHHQYVEPKTTFMEVRQYNKRGILIAASSCCFPNKQDRPRHPKEK